MTTQRIARAVRRLGERKLSCGKLRHAVDRLSATGPIVVDGEAIAVAELERLVRSADASLQVLAADTPTDVDELALLEDAISEANWEVVAFLESELAAKEQQAATARAACEARLNDQRKQLGLLRLATEAARARLVATRQDEQCPVQHDAIEQQARRALVDAPYAELEKQIVDLEKRDARGRTAELVRRTQTAPGHWRQAELLLIRSVDEDRDHSQYSVILRTPGEPGVQGLIVQGSTTMTRANREALLARGRLIEAALAGEDVRGPAGENRSIAGAFLDDDRLKPLEGIAQDLGEEMFTVILPPAMQGYFQNNDCSLTITTNDLELPWELMSNPRSDDPRILCVGRPMARRQMGSVFPMESRRRTVPTPRTKLRFLLLGADDRGGLPAVKREIDKIRQALCDEFGATIDVDSPAATFTVLDGALRRGTYDVIHYAGHASFDRAYPQRSALALDDGDFLAERIARTVAGSPVVFLNACGTAATRPDAPSGAIDSRIVGSAEGLASAFIEGGALGCIGNLWPVNDGAAGDFAVDVYKHLVEGETLGQSILAARRAAHGACPERVTWASFVLFGNPLFRIS